MNKGSTPFARQLIRGCMLTALFLPASLAKAHVPEPLTVPGALTSIDRTVTGKVLAREDNTPIPGVTVVVKGTTTGTTTDVDGK